MVSFTTGVCYLCPSGWDTRSFCMKYDIYCTFAIIVLYMMTSSSGNIFHVTGPLCGEFTGHWWIPHTKASDTELWCFILICSRTNSSANNRDAGDLRGQCIHYDHCDEWTLFYDWPCYNEPWLRNNIISDIYHIFVDISFEQLQEANCFVSSWDVFVTQVTTSWPCVAICIRDLHICMIISSSPGQMPSI